MAKTWRSQIMKSEVLQQHNKYAWVLAWPMILLALLNSCTHAGEAASSDTTERDTVNGFGQKAISAYVSASPVDPAAVTAIYGAMVAAGRGGGFPFPAERVVAVIGRTPMLQATRSDKTRVWSVSADVLTPDGAQGWQQQVLITAEGVLRVEGLPGRIPLAPAAVPDQDNEHGQELTKVEPGSPVYTTVSDFFNAWLTGKGDLNRVANDSIPAFSAAPYSRTTIESVTASRNPEKIEKSITVSAVISAQKTTTTRLAYTLELAAAGGRWVVSDIAASRPDQ